MPIEMPVCRDSSAIAVDKEPPAILISRSCADAPCGWMLRAASDKAQMIAFDLCFQAHKVIQLIHKFRAILCRQHA